jgi:putative endonuclease
MVTLGRKALCGSRGAAAERRAAQLLAAQGLTVIARHVRGRHGEIGQISEDRGTRVIVEVRQRARADFGGSLQSVTAAKQRRILRSTARFLMGDRRWRDARIRFDVIGFDGAPDDRARLTWVRDAFRGG